MNCAEDVAINPKASNLVCDKSDCLLLSGREAESLVIVMDYCEPMHFAAVIVDDCDDYRVALVNLDVFVS